MIDLAPPPDLLKPIGQAADRISGAAQDKIRQTAADFEATFLAQMMKPMFEGLSTDGPFGGGHAEQTWRSFMVDEMAKKTVAAGGIGLAVSVMGEMLKMQEQSQ